MGEFLRDAGICVLIMGAAEILLFIVSTLFASFRD